SFLLSTRRPPPRPTLFPYTTLFRSAPPATTGCLNPQHVARLEQRARFGRERHAVQDSSPGGTLPAAPRARGAVAAPLGEHAQLRSEEHTSELQSRFDLVCRLLLEKK